VTSNAQVIHGARAGVGGAFRRICCCCCCCCCCLLLLLLLLNCFVRIISNYHESIDVKKSCSSFTQKKEAFAEEARNVLARPFSPVAAV
jgi:hypothetical protein